MLPWSGPPWLAPLTKGGNLPFRRLCLDFGAQITMSEMAYARQVVRRSKSELALLRKHPDETCFGVQLAARDPEEAIAAGKEAVARGASFVDLNCGCPIHDVVRRGMGATLLQRPQALARLVAAMVAGLPVPVTVKLRSGWSEEEINAPELARLLEEAGAAAVTLHARTREQRYTKGADWSLIRQLVTERRIPIIGNGDILTYYEAKARQAESGCAAVMLGRGVLIKPWLFAEIARGESILPTATERIAIYRRLAVYMKQHFRDDAKGRERTMRFLPWHLGFFCRYRPLPESEWLAASQQHPLLQTRMPAEPDLPLLEQLLRDPREEVHARLADALWEASSDDDAVARLTTIAASMPPVVDEAGEVATAHG